MGLALEVVPNVAKAVKTTATLATGIAANTPTTSVTLSAPVQLTSGTNLEFTAADSSKVVAYVASTMGSASATVPVTSFTTTSAIASASTVTVGVNSTYLGLDVQNSGSQSASAAVSISAPAYIGNPATTPAFVFGLNFDISAANPNGTAINIGGSWGAALNCNGSNISNIGSMVGVVTSPNSDVRLVDKLPLDNSRYIKMKNAAGAAKGVMRSGPTDNLRFVLPGASNEFQFLRHS